MNKTRFYKPKTTYSIIAFIMTVLIAMSATVIPASAYTADKKGTITYNYDFYQSNKDLCDSVYKGMLDLQAPIDVTAFNIDKTTARAAFQTVVRTHPELFYVNTFKVGYATSGSQVAMIFPFYFETVQSIGEKKDLFKQQSDVILDKLDSSMTDLQKALIIHDQLILRSEYGIGSSDTQGTSAYDAIVNGISACQGYTLAYSYLLSQAGISNEFVESTNMYHSWNKISIGGSYYNVDVTYDDPTPDRAGHVSHVYFLLSDNAISTDTDTVESHYGFDSTHYKATSTKYDSKLFHEIDTQFCKVNNDWFAIDNKTGSVYEKTLLNYNPDTDKVTKIASFNYVWKTANGLGHWNGGYTSLAEKDGMLYFNSNDSVYMYNTNTKQTTMVSDCSTKNISGSIYGMYISDGKIFVLTGNSPTESNEQVMVCKCPEPVSTIEPIPTVSVVKLDKGDADGDGDVGVSDATYLQRYFAGVEDLTEEQMKAADTNGDGYVDISDATLIQRYAAGLEEFK